ncbi:hypothetical protein, partial [Erythrobacter sp. YJ-T3-07]|uniref:hypothetical protein n=1 Tax=Erythrobacter sp. YJ-T3-07 TaxID=2793063 RepID=UPI001F23BF0D
MSTTSTPPERSTATPTQTKDIEMPTKAELYEIAAKSLQTGALTGELTQPVLICTSYTKRINSGMMGCFVGLGSGIMRNAPPALFAAFAGFQWFTLGSSFVGKDSV